MTTLDVNRFEFGVETLRTKKFQPLWQEHEHMLYCDRFFDKASSSRKSLLSDLFGRK
jgi:hypothetical protein